MGINAEYMGVASRTMATPEHQARIDAARKPPYEMEGAPTSTTQITSPAPATVEKYANGDQKTVADDGDITYQYQGRDVAQYSHHLGTRDGMVITYFTDGSREQVMPNGAILEAPTDTNSRQTQMAVPLRPIQTPRLLTATSPLVNFPADFPWHGPRSRQCRRAYQASILSALMALTSNRIQTNLSWPT